jgi:hypothetical protein
MYCEYARSIAAAAGETLALAHSSIANNSWSRCSTGFGGFAPTTPFLPRRAEGADGTGRDGRGRGSGAPGRS